MAQPKVPPTERIASSFKQIAVASSDLSNATSDLIESISSLEAGLRRVDVQVAAWFQIAGGEDGPESWTRDLGWSKVKSSWCIAIRTTSDNAIGDEHDETVWAFKDAPRWMILESVGRLPDLFETIVKRTIEAAEKMRDRKREADAFIVALEEVLPQAIEEAVSVAKAKKRQ